MRMTFGYELELGDVRRSLVIPEEFGAWEYAERDPMNLREPYRFRRVDPLGIDPPVGGEINIKPAKTPFELASRIRRLLEWLGSQGEEPTVCILSHGHVHVRTVGLRDDINALRRVARWIGDNQNVLVEKVHAVDYVAIAFAPPAVRNYFRYDGGRMMPDWMIEHLTKAKDFDDFIRLHRTGKDLAQTLIPRNDDEEIGEGRPLRYAINTYCLKHIDTVEFRFFWASLDLNEIYGSILLAEALMKDAISRRPKGAECILGQGFHFPPFRYDQAQAYGWVNSPKWGPDRGKKNRVFVDI